MNLNDPIIEDPPLQTTPQSSMTTLPRKRPRSNGLDDDSTSSSSAVLPEASGSADGDPPAYLEPAFSGFVDILQQSSFLEFLRHFRRDLLTTPSLNLLDRLSQDIRDRNPDRLLIDIDVIDDWFSLYPQTTSVDQKIALRAVQRAWQALQVQLQELLGRVSMPIEPKAGLANRNIAQVKKIGPPSEVAHSSVYFTRVNPPGDAQILNLRPPYARGPSITLYHPVFAEFMEHLHGNTRKIHHDTYIIAQTFCDLAGERFPTEADRQLAMTPLFTELLGQEPKSVGVPRARSDGVLYDENQQVPVIVWEYKNEMGSGGGEAYIQGSLTLAKFWATPVAGSLLARTYAPSFIVTIVGPYICVSGAVWLQKLVVMPLTDYIHMVDLPLLPGAQIERVARVLSGLRAAFFSLRAYYNNVAHAPELKDAFPHFGSYQVPHLGKVDIVYSAQLGDKPLWTGEAIPKEGTRFPVVIKLTPKYSEAAHQLLEKHGLAPKLFHVGAADATGWRMVVMEHVQDAVSGEELLQLSNEQKQQVIRSISLAIKTLHKHSMVFGDLRLPNVLVQPSPLRVLLVDFDWCGHTDEARYPPNINMRDIHWPEGVGPGERIVLQHDLTSIQNITDKLGQGYKSPPQEAPMGD